jgi:hypothetical protein
MKQTSKKTPCKPKDTVKNHLQKMIAAIKMEKNNYKNTKNI